MPAIVFGRRPTAQRTTNAWAGRAAVVLLFDIGYDLRFEDSHAQSVHQQVEGLLG
jgi:hypothetical protein